MKRILFLTLFFCMLLLCVCNPLLTLAEEAGAPSMAAAGYLTPQEFVYFAGQVTFVLLVVQFIKLPIDRRIGKVRTEYIVYGVALVAQVLAQVLLYGFASFSLAFIPKCIAYALLVAVTAKEVYVKAIGNVEAKKSALQSAQEDDPFMGK